MDNIKEIDTRGMSCAQATFQAKRALLENFEFKNEVHVIAGNVSASESIIRACGKFKYYSSHITETDTGNFIIVFKM